MIKKVQKKTVIGLNNESEVQYYLTYNNDKTNEGNDKVWVVPHDEDNRMYRDILEWVAEGNTIAEAD